MTYSSKNSRDDGDEFTAGDMILTEGARCAACGKELPLDVSPKNFIKGRWFCESCLGKVKASYTEGLKETPEMLEQKAQFYEEVRRVFGINEVPDWWIKQMNKFFQNGPKRNYKIASYVLYYVTKIRGIEPEYEFGLSFISRYYEEAKEFLTTRRQVLLDNDKKGYATHPRTVQIQPPQSRNRKLTDIENL